MVSAANHQGSTGDEITIIAVPPLILRFAQDKSRMML